MAAVVRHCGLLLSVLQQLVNIAIITIKLLTVWTEPEVLQSSHQHAESGIFLCSTKYSRDILCYIHISFTAICQVSRVSQLPPPLFSSYSCLEREHFWTKCYKYCAGLMHSYHSINSIRQATELCTVNAIIIVEYKQWKFCKCWRSDF